jgi:hypothetical protein
MQIIAFMLARFLSSLLKQSLVTVTSFAPSTGLFGFGVKATQNKASKVTALNNINLFFMVIFLSPDPEFI